MKIISFMIPLFNEELNIVKVIETIAKAASFYKYDYEIIIVDDGSRDNSYMVVTSLLSQYPEIKLFKNTKNLGFAKTYLRCLEESSSRYVMYISSDNDIDYLNLKSLISNLGVTPIVLQYCLNPKDRKYYRYLISRFYTMTQNFINNKKLKYYNGFNIYQTDLLKSIEITEKGFSFQAEIVSKMIEKHKFTEVGLYCQFNDSTSSAMKLNNILNTIAFIVNGIFKR